jgi:UbiD family decarboxylase
MIRNLREFINILRAEKDIVEIDAPVDARLEAAEIHRRVIAANGPALLFKNIKGASFPLVTNLFGTAKRVELAFGPKPGRLISQIAHAPESLLPPSLGKIWDHRELLGSLAKVGLKRSSAGPITECIDTPAKLTRLPLLTTWPEDGGPFITLPLVLTKHPEKDVTNLGMYRIQRFDDDRTGVHMQIGKGGGFHLAAHRALNKPMPVSIFIGGPPALILSAISPLPENVPELLFSSLLLGGRLPVVKNPINGLLTPAEAEFALVGEVLPNEMHPEGPFGDHYGYYSLKHDYPLFRCKALMHRKDAICAATVVGKPRQEDFYLGDFLQELLLPLVKLVMPGVLDLWSYGETGYHALTAARVTERYSREAMASAFRILGEGQLSLTKFLLLTDGATDLRDFKKTLQYILERADFRSDLFIFSNLSMDSLDYAGPKVNEGSKGVLLGVGAPIRSLPTELPATAPAGAKDMKIFCPGALVIEGPSFEQDRNFAANIARDSALKNWPLVVLCDSAKKCARSPMNFLWTTFTRFEPAADIHASGTDIIRNHLAYTPPIVIDARMKPWYPKELFCDPETKDLVSQRWKEYFPSGQEMGDSDLAHLDSI